MHLNTSMMAINNLEALLTPPALRIAKEKEQTSSYHYCSPTRNSSTSTTASMNRNRWGMRPQSLTVIKKRRDANGQSRDSHNSESSSSEPAMNLDSPEQSEFESPSRLFGAPHPLN